MEAGEVVGGFEKGVLAEFSEEDAGGGGGPDFAFSLIFESGRGVLIVPGGGVYVGCFGWKNDRMVDCWGRGGGVVMFDILSGVIIVQLFAWVDV